MSFGNLSNDDPTTSQRWLARDMQLSNRNDHLPGKRSHSSLNPTVLVKSLTRWFDTHARDLPWRRTSDPYAIWVSEIMLQQTQVKTVIPYWERWMAELPTIQAMANAPLEKLYKLWEGLGYYRRARHMQAAAARIVSEHHGVFPSNYDAVLALPGIGRYTAGAICSIAFHQPTPILDGNVVRVLTRIFGIRADPREKKTNARLWRLSHELVTRAFAVRPGKRVRVATFNQSLMELGAMVCLPRQPRCAQCPVSNHCMAFRTNSTDRIPRPKARSAATSRYFAAYVVRHGQKYLVRQRPASEVNGTLWEFPNLEIQPGEDGKAFGKTLGLAEDRTGHLTRIKHTITRYRITLDVFAHAASRRPGGLAGEWLTLDALSRLPFSSAHRQIIDQLEAMTRGS